MFDDDVDFKTVYKNTYIWSSNTETWKKGPYLPSRFCCGAAISSWDQSSMFLVGGRFNIKIGQEGLLSTIYKFRCWSSNIGDCHWQLLDQQLKTPRDDFVAIMIPSELVTCGNLSSNLDQCFQEDQMLIGDGICDDKSNIDECFFDGGDCCLTEIVAFFCTDCICQEDSMKRPTKAPTENSLPTFPKTCDLPFYDGFNFGIGFLGKYIDI